MNLTPIGPLEFERLMGPVGPFGRERRVVVGVSGGADSLALALLLRGWGQPVAVVVDHGLRPASADEAALTLERLAAMGVPARLERLAGLVHGADLGVRAREGRYGALLRVCRELGLPDLLVAHHAQDQVETVRMRAARGSGPAGLAGMAAIGWRADARILRPLLPIGPERLRATLCEAGTAWVEDPSNRDTGTARGLLRSRPMDVAGGALAAGAAGHARRADEAALACELGRRVAIFPAGYACVRAPLSEGALSALVWTVSGRAYPPARTGLARLAHAGEGTLHGVLVRGGVVTREPAAVGAAVAAVAGARWDNRFSLRTAVPGATLGAIGVGVSSRRRSGLPSAVRQGLPVVRLGTDLFISSDVAYLDAATWISVCVEFRPSRPLAGAPFVPA